MVVTLTKGRAVPTLHIPSHSLYSLPCLRRLQFTGLGSTSPAVPTDTPQPTFEERTDWTIHAWGRDRKGLRVDVSAIQGTPFIMSESVGWSEEVVGSSLYYSGHRLARQLFPFFWFWVLSLIFT